MNTKKLEKDIENLQKSLTNIGGSFDALLNQGIKQLAQHDTKKAKEFQDLATKLKSSETESEVNAHINNLNNLVKQYS